MIMLTVKQVAELKGCSESYIQRLFREGNIVGELHDDIRQIPLSALEPALQKKYYRKNALLLPAELRRAKASEAKPPERVKSLEEFTVRQRQQIEERTLLVKSWEAFRLDWPDNDMAAADNAFVMRFKAGHRGKSISAPTLYRYRKAVEENNLDALVDKRSQFKKGKSKINNEVWTVFISYYLEEGSRYSAAKCWRHTKEYCEFHRPDLLPYTNVSIDAIEWRIKKEIPLPVIEYNRYGRKRLHDRWAPYISRTYDEMRSNEYWVADNYTLDFMSRDGNNVIHRLYLTADIDARSQMIVGWQVTPKPCGDATLMALRNSIMPPDGRPTNGVPENYYCDNGSEFLVHDIGGRGHRTRKKSEEAHQPPGVFARMGINMVNAIPGNPEAKLIERIFRVLKEEFCAAMDTFCGGNIMERPERLSKMLKDGHVPSDEEVIAAIGDFITGYYNHMPYTGKVQKDRGKPRIQVYNENIEHFRIMRNTDDLNLLLMRSSRMVTVGRRGVTGVPLSIAGHRIDYWTPEFLAEWGGKPVYYRYDPQDLAEIRVYDEDDKFVCTLPADNMTVLEYGVGKNDIKIAMKMVRKYNQCVRDWTGGKLLTGAEKITVGDLMMRRARENIQNPPEYATKRDNIKVIEFVSALEEEYYQEPMAVGDNNYILQDMIANLKQRQRQEDNDHEY